MGRHAEVTIAWADDEYTFRLGIKQLLQLQEKCDAGPQYIVSRLANGSWFVNDIRETIRQGLLGGDEKRTTDEVRNLITQHVDERPLLESLPIARTILLATLLPIEDDPIPKAAAAEGSGQPSAGKSPSPPSTETEPPSGSAPPRSTG